MILEEKIHRYLEDLTLTFKDKSLSVSRLQLASDLAQIAEKFYVAEVLRPAHRVNELEQQIENQIVIAEGEVICTTVNPERIIIGDKTVKEIKNKLEDEITKHFDKQVKIILEVEQ